MDQDVRLVQKSFLCVKFISQKNFNRCLRELSGEYLLIYLDRCALLFLKTLSVISIISSLSAALHFPIIEICWFLMYVLLVIFISIFHSALILVPIIHHISYYSYINLISYDFLCWLFHLIFLIYILLLFI